MQKINNAKNQAGKVLAGIFVFSLICGSLLSSVTEAAVNQQINYQGKLTDGSSVNVPDGVYNIKFRLYVDSSTTTPLWTELRESSNRVQVTSGLFSVMLGEVTDFTGVDFNQTLYLGVTVGGSSTTPAYDPEMSPRKKLGVVPAAIQAVYLGSASSTQYLRNDQPGVLSTTTSSTLLTLNQTGAGNLFGVQKSGTELFTILNNGNVGVGTTSPGAKLDIYGTSSLSTIDLFAVSSSTNTRLFTIGASGYVGVGVSSPGFKMDLQGTDSFSAYYTTRYSNDNQPTGVVGRKARGTQAAPSGTLLDDYIALLGGRGYGSTSFSGVSNGAVNIRASENFTDSAYGTYVTIETTPTGSTTRTEKLRITGSGNVGIGSTTPGSLLSVAGDISFTGALRVSGNAGTNGMILQTTGTGTQWIATTSLGFPVAVTPAFTIGNGLIYNATSTDLVGIGTTTPAEKLDVNGNISLNNNQLINGFVKNTIPDNKATNSGTTLTGTMYFADAGAISSGTVTGIGTLFSSELKVGDKINNITGASGGEFGGQAENFYIKQIVSNTSLILSRAGGSQSTGSGSAFSAKRYRSIYSVADNSGVLSFAITDGGFYGAGSNNYGIGSMAPNSFIWNGNAQFSTGANAGDISFYRWVSTGGWNTAYSSNGSPDLIVGDPVGANGGTAGRLSVGGATPLGALTAYTNTPTTKGLSIKGATAQSADYFNVSSSSGTGDIFTILSSGNVGVGSSTPGSLFSVAGDISFTGALRVSGNAGTNGMILQTTGTGAQWVATSSLGITGGSGNSAFTLGNGVIYNATSTDLVGIGTSTPYTTLTIQGKGGTNPFTIASSTGAQLFTVLQSGSIGVGTTTPGALFAITGQSGSTGQIFDVASSSGASYLHVMSSGNVGVGTSTPGSLFSVAGDISFIGALRTSGNAGVNGSVLQTTGTGSQWVATSTLGFLSSTVTSSLTNGFLPAWTGSAFTNSIFRGNASSTGINATSSSYAFNVQGSLGVTNIFNVASSTGVSLFTILGNGNVGIGTTTPSARLDIYGTTTSATTDLFAISSSTNTRLFTIGANGAVGIGTTTPTGIFAISSPNQATAGAAALNAMTVLGGTGSTTGAGAAVVFTTGAGGASGGVGGAFSVTTGAGGASGGAGGAISFTTGSGIGSGAAGGAFTVTGGTPGSTAPGGAISLTAGSAGSSGSAGGTLTLASGSGGSSGAGGPINITAGTSASGSTGPTVTITAGASAATGGTLALLGGASSGSTGGPVTMTGGAGGSGGSGGALTLTGGTGGSSSSGGAISITAGASGGSGGVGAAVNITAANGGGSSNAAGGNLVFTAGTAASGGGTGNGGSISFIGGSGGSGTTAIGGNIFIAGGDAVGTTKTYGDTILAMTSTGANRGNVGIGSSTPSARLTVVGTSSTAGGIFDVASSTFASFFRVTNAGSVGVGTTTPISTFSIKGTGGTNPFAIASSTGLQLFTILQNGNVGIGSSTPSQALSVNGTVSATNLLGGATTASIDVSGNLIRTPSDFNLKENIQSLSGTTSLDKIMHLQGVSYDFKDKNFATGQQVGFIAQDVQKIVPEVVTSGGTYLSLNYGNLVAVVVEAVKQIGSAFTKIDNGIAYMKEVVVERFTVGSSAKPSGITIYDESTGSPFCIKVVNSQMMNIPGVCGSTQVASPPPIFATPAISSSAPSSQNTSASISGESSSSNTPASPTNGGSTKSEVISPVTPADNSPTAPSATNSTASVNVPVQTSSESSTPSGAASAPAVEPATTNN